MSDPTQGGRPPSVDALARSLVDCGLPHPLLVDAARRAIAAGDPGRARAEAVAIARTLLQPVINATGVLLHTNLGRAPLARLQGATYSNLELDLVSGDRGSRSAHAAALMARACGGDAGLIVNNGAAAVLLVLAALARGRSVVVSRGELVEIGGGFRVPEVMAESGARLVEVGTTNRTRIADYERALADPGNDVALVLKVHKSNYRIEGFTGEVGIEALGGLGDPPRPLVVDLGSGLLDSACPWLPDGPPAWLRDEPAARQTLLSGADLIVFSGDKLLGGPQAGVIVGRADLVAACARHPLARALRPGGLVLGAMQDVALAYLGRTAQHLPFWRMATVPVAELERRVEALGVGEPVATTAVTGGGTLPGVDVPSAGIALDGDRTAGLRAFHPPVIARVRDGQTLLDLRTVEPADDPTVADAVRAATAADA
ncbi:MAG: L-seryl-tRNA(Sec) selenium transferase [Actinomycetota bacterium]|nr:L-seryl-tRNA(Sec) selenium transferase [Actinomycetota bacterium]